MPPKPEHETTAGPDEVGRVNRLYAVLSKVNEAIVRVHQPQELFDAACKIAVQDGQFLLAWIGLVEADSKYVRCIAKHGHDDGYVDGLRVSFDETVPEGQGPTAVSLRSGRPFINNDTENNPIMRPWRDAQLSRGYRSSASFPLSAGGKTIGVITLYAGEPNYFDDEEIRLLECLADDFSFALESAEVARQRAEAVEALRALNDDLEIRVAERTTALNQMLEERADQATFAEALLRIQRAVHSTFDVEEIVNRAIIDIANAIKVDAAGIATRERGVWGFPYTHGLPKSVNELRFSDAQVPLSAEVFETGRSVVSNDVAADAKVNGPLMEEFDIKALMAAPLMMRGQVFGILMVNRFGEPRPFTEGQLNFLERAASILGLALENARLYENEHQIADRLQEALLSMPIKMSGIEFASAYHSATEGTRVGATSMTCSSWGLAASA